MAGLILSLAVSMGTGFFLTCVLWPLHKGARGTLAARAALAVGLGLGVSSCVFFVCTVLWGPSVTAFLSVELAVLVCLAVVAGRSFLTAEGPSASEGRPSDPAAARMRAVLVIALLLLTVLGVVSFATLVSMKPHGDWDAYVSWNLRARFLFRGGPIWQRAFSGLVPRACPDYPVFLPCLVARCWYCAGTDTVAAPVVVAALFTFGVVGLGLAAVRVLRGTLQGLLAGTLLLATPYLLMHGTSQYADVPMAFFFLATAVLLTFAGHFPGSRSGLLALAGFACGLATYAKHEGLLFLLGLTVVAVVWLIRTPERKSCLKQLAAFTAGLALPLLLLVYFKTALAPKQNYMVASIHTDDVLRRLGELSRYAYIARAFLAQVFNVARWDGLPVVLPFYLLLAGAALDPRHTAAVFTSTAALGFMILGQFVVYLITHDNIEWHVTYSIDRFLLELWPTMVFLFLLVVRTPEEAMSADVQRSAER